MLRTRTLAAALVALTAYSLAAHAAGRKGGLVVHLGCDDGSHIAKLLRAVDNRVVHALDTDVGKIEQARGELDKLGLYGKASVHRFSGEALPHADRLINVLVAEDLFDVSLAEIDRALAPLGLVVLKMDDKKAVDEARRELQRAGFEEVDRAEAPTFRKPWPERLDQWGHYLHGADGNAVAEDALAGPPRYMRWVAGPMFPRSHDYTPSLHSLVSAGGRLYYVQDEGRPGFLDRGEKEHWALRARDAFSGVDLWRRPISGWSGRDWGSRYHWHNPRTLPRRLVADGDRLFATLSYRAPVTLLDGATGKTLREYPETKNTEEIILADGVLIARVRKEIPDFDKRARSWGFQVPAKSREEAFSKLPPAERGDETILALDPDDAKVLWRVSESRIVSLTLASRNGKVCFHNHEEIVCRDLKSGDVLWKAASQPWPEFTGAVGTLLMDDERVYYACDRGLKAWSLDDGELVWEGPKAIMAAPMHPPDLFRLGDTLWIGMTREMTSGTLPRELSRFQCEAFHGTDALGLDPQTGKVKRRVPIGSLLSGGHHVRCYRGKATSRYLIWSKRGADFVDTSGEGNHARVDWTRGECDYGFLPCNGLFYTPPHPCVCYSGVLINGFNALSAVQSDGRSEPAGAILEKGPACATHSESRVSGGASPAWPTYRGDIRRSGSLGAPIATELGQAWSADLGGNLTQSVVAEGTVIVAAKDQHLVHALDAASGRRLWRFRAGGRVDSPPTVHRQAVLFGAHDGHVYCLRLADGALIWRRRAAPEERWIVSYGQVESAWPVTGSVLLLEDASSQSATAYFVAGRSSFLDGGLHLYGLDPATGEVRHRRRMDGPWPDVISEPGGPHGMDGARSDILVSNGEHLFLGANVLSRSLEIVNTDVPQGGGGGVARGPLRLSTTMGFLADDFYDRQHWIHHQGFLSKSMPRGGTKSGYLLVFDDEDTYTLNAFHTPTGQSMGMGKGPDPFRLSAESNDRPMGEGRGHLLKPSPRPARWSEKLAFFGRALLLAEDKLLVAGTSDFLPADDPSDDYLAGRRAELRIFAAKDGQCLKTFPLEAMPVFDGMSAAGEHVFLSCLDGSVRCLKPVGGPGRRDEPKAASETRGRQARLHQRAARTAPANPSSSLGPVIMPEERD